MSALRSRQIGLTSAFLASITIPGLVHLALGGNEWAVEIEARYNDIVDSIAWKGMDFARKKKLTSYLRRLLPNGQANEIFFSVNLRALRHLRVHLPDRRDHHAAQLGGRKDEERGCRANLPETTREALRRRGVSGLSPSPSP